MLLHLLLVLLWHTTPACPTEDSPGPCHWNAHSQGNHHGRSFIEWNGHTYYVHGGGFR